MRLDSHDILEIPKEIFQVDIFNIPGMVNDRIQPTILYSASRTSPSWRHTVTYNSQRSESQRNLKPRATKRYCTCDTGHTPSQSSKDL